MATAFSPQERERIRDSLLDAALKSAATQGMAPCHGRWPGA